MNKLLRSAPIKGSLAGNMRSCKDPKYAREVWSGAHARVLKAPDQTGWPRLGRYGYS